MLELLKKLCTIDGTSGDESRVREFIIGEIKDYCEYKTDNLGNLICFKKGNKTPEHKIMLDAHMDEVGFIITSVTDDGFLKFSTVGGIDTAALLSKRVKIADKVYGVIGCKPMHLLDNENRKKLPPSSQLYIDIGALSKTEALEKISIGDCGVFASEFHILGENVKSKALDDRIGCLILIKLIKEFSDCDFYAVFSTQEEVGLRGAKASTFSVNPDFAIVLESTTASDIADVPDDQSVCNLGEGPAVSFMDGATVYDKELYNFALASGMCQPKRAVAGGNNAGSIHLSGDGVRTVAISAPCRYIHSSSNVANISDIEKMYELSKYMLINIANGKVK